MDSTTQWPARPPAVIASATVLAAVVQAARARITDADRWCRGSLAQDKDHNVAMPDAPTAIRWCAVGALVAEGAAAAPTLALESDLTDSLNLALTNYLEPLFDPDLDPPELRHRAIEYLEFVNDDVDGHPAVLALLDSLAAWISGAREVSHVG